MDRNHVTLTSVLTRAPIARFAETGTEQVTGTLACTEPNAAGEAFTLCVPCEPYGPVGEHVGALRAGAAVQVAGTLQGTSWTDTQGQKRTSLCVLARMVKPIVSASVPVGEATQ